MEKVALDTYKLIGLGVVLRYTSIIIIVPIDQEKGVTTIVIEYVESILRQVRGSESLTG